MGGCNTLEEGDLGRQILLQNTPHRSIVEAMEAGSFTFGVSHFKYDGESMGYSEGNIGI